MQLFFIVDCPFNRIWFPNIVGTITDHPPGYAVVRVVKP